MIEDAMKKDIVLVVVLLIILLTFIIDFNVIAKQVCNNLKTKYLMNFTEYNYTLGPVPLYYGCAWKYNATVWEEIS
jgi:hypothetical protein